MTASSSTTEMLLEAIEQGDSNRVRSILQSDLTLLNKPINGEMSTPLHLACSNENRFKVVRVLLSFDGVLVNTQDLLGSTPLSLASRFGCVETVKELLKRGDIDVNITDAWGWSALFWASNWGCQDTLRLLLADKRVKRNIRDKKGKTACEVICEGISADKSQKTAIEQCFKPSSSTLDFIVLILTLILLVALYFFKDRNRTAAIIVLCCIIVILPTWFFFLRSQKRERITSAPEKTYPLPRGKQSHCFLTHNWSNGNHEKVSKINAALQNRGFITWFDEDKMEGQIRQAMTEALSKTCCVVICLTKIYEAKVNAALKKDNCYFEFNYAANHPSLAETRVAIATEKEMVYPNNWNPDGRLFAEFGGDLILDFSEVNDEKTFQKSIDDLEKILKSFLKL